MINCGFCEVKIKSIWSNNGSSIANIIGKEELSICDLCNGLEIRISFGYMINLEEIFKLWFEKQNQIAKYNIQRNGYDKYFLIKETL